MAGLRNRQAFKKFPEYSDAIIALAADHAHEAAFSITGNDYSSFNWLTPDLRKPTEDEIIKKLDELMLEYEAQAYRWERYQQYLTVEEQLNQLYDDMEKGIIPGKEDSAWFNYIKEIKEKIK